MADADEEDWISFLRPPQVLGLQKQIKLWFKLTNNRKSQKNFMKHPSTTLTLYGTNLFNNIETVKLNQQMPFKSDKKIKHLLKDYSKQTSIIASKTLFSLATEQVVEFDLDYPAFGKDNIILTVEKLFLRNFYNGPFLFLVLEAKCLYKSPGLLGR